jgi:hypothetical protein
MSKPPLPRALTAVLAIAALCAVGAVANAKMTSKRIGPALCETTGGGKFVKIPGFPGERIDRRLLADVRLLVRKYKIFITDGFSTDPVHSPNGEHPLGLALDIVPDRSRGGTWRDIDRLARWAEPRQNQPRPPFRWVGYNGDAGHGRGHHLHLSWSHSAKTRFGRPVRTVYSLRCPGGGEGKTGPGKGQGGGKGKGGKGPSHGGTKPGPSKKGKTPPRQPSSKGGIAPGESKEKATGGISAKAMKRKLRRQRGSRSSVETGGVGLR